MSEPAGALAGGAKLASEFRGTVPPYWTVPPTFNTGASKLGYIGVDMFGLVPLPGLGARN